MIADVQRELAHALQVAPDIPVLWPGSDTIAAALLPVVQRLIDHERSQALLDAADWVRTVPREFAASQIESGLRVKAGLAEPVGADSGEHDDDGCTDPHCSAHGDPCANVP